LSALFYTRCLNSLKGEGVSLLRKLVPPLLLVALGIFFLATHTHSSKPAHPQNAPAPADARKVITYPLHRRITATVFWVGEEATSENAHIANVASSWDEHWREHFGGVDDPNHRRGYAPAGFTPQENPFYCALPYSDFDKEGRKANTRRIPWAAEQQWAAHESMCKNRWLRITRGAKTAYAQWEDAGPFQSDDTDYVFGTAPPRNTVNHHAGLDVSPAVRDYLGLSGDDKVDWQFVDVQDVPDGPWKQVVTTSQVTWE